MPALLTVRHWSFLAASNAVRRRYHGDPYSVVPLFRTVWASWLNFQENGAVRLAKIVNPDERRIFWEDLYAGPLKEQVFNDNIAEADRLIEQALQEWQKPKGEVYRVRVIQNC